MALRRATPLKKTALAVAVFALAVLIVLPVVGSVNLSAGKPVTIVPAQYADSSPLPPPIPPKPPSMNATLVADSSPLPPPIPPKPPQSQTLA
jgi:hypothetical protein